mmetsp:Transcript_60414/g.187482  ORF Transcript_60414/g.187482 Transcript_60414/m.187482 type:complete len:217 (+) Transcript_60414:706-1356(+)
MRRLRLGTALRRPPEDGPGRAPRSPRASRGRSPGSPRTGAGRFPRSPPASAGRPPRSSPRWRPRRARSLRRPPLEAGPRLPRRPRWRGPRQKALCPSSATSWPWTPWLRCWTATTRSRAARRPADSTSLQIGGTRRRRLRPCSAPRARRVSAASLPCRLLPASSTQAAVLRMCTRNRRRRSWLSSVTSRRRTLTRRYAQRPLHCCGTWRSAAPWGR